MNPILEDRLIKMHMLEIHEDFLQNSLQEQAINNTQSQKRWSSQVMEQLGNWLILQGEKLVSHQNASERKYSPSSCDYAQ